MTEQEMQEIFNDEKAYLDLMNCIMKPKRLDCPWETCKKEHETIEIPLDLAKCILNMIQRQRQQQEAVKYKTRGDEWDSAVGSRWYVCGICENPIDPKDMFCRHCGMKVRWE